MTYVLLASDPSNFLDSWVMAATPDKEKAERLFYEARRKILDARAYLDDDRGEQTKDEVNEMALYADVLLYLYKIDFEGLDWLAGNSPLLAFEVERD